MKKALKIIKNIFVGFLILVIVGNLYIILMQRFSSNKMPRFLGFAYNHVITESMVPTIDEKDIYITFAKSKYKKGDIITFKSGNSIVVHRIDSINEFGQYITKGDANNSVDSNPVDQKNVIGKVIIILPIRGFVEFFKTTEGIIITFVVIGLIWFSPNIIRWIKGEDQPNRNKKLKKR